MPGFIAAFQSSTWHCCYIIYHDRVPFINVCNTLELLQVNQTSKQTEYHGAVLRTVKALADVPHGGQILMDAKTFEGIKLLLDDLYQSISHGPDIAAMQENCRSA